MVPRDESVSPRAAPGRPRVERDRYRVGLFICGYTGVLLAVSNQPVWSDAGWVLGGCSSPRPWPGSPRCCFSSRGRGAIRRLRYDHPPSERTVLRPSSRAILIRALPGVGRIRRNLEPSPRDLDRLWIVVVSLPRRSCVACGPVAPPWRRRSSRYSSARAARARHLQRADLANRRSS